MNKKLNKKQLRIYNYLLDRPGYLKKSEDFIINQFHKYQLDAPFPYMNSDVQIALKRIKFDKKFTNKMYTIKKSYKVTGSSINPTLSSKKSVNIVDKQQFDKRNILIIGDTHFPFCKEGYIEFCKETQVKYNCGSIVHIGDLVDNHAVSYHESDPDGRSPGDEYKLALEECEKIYKLFPEVVICIGNHDKLPFRKAYTAGLPKNWLKSYQEMFNSPKGWKWDFVHEINGVIFQHGTGLSGEMASINAARENRKSTVIGHLHTVCNTRFLASYKDLIFGMNVGCGIDHTKYAFAYGRENTRKPVLSCGVVLDGKLPINIPMNI